MCIVFVVASPSSEYKFAFAFNRDESFLRETAHLQYWEDLGIYCGRDVKKGGTWLAIDQKGRFVAITNIKRPILNENNPSRGSIPLELLKQEKFEPSEWKRIIQSLECKNVNVLFGDLNNQGIPEVYVYSSDTSELSKVSFDKERVFSLANGDINSNWSKQEKGKEMIKNFIHENDFNESSLFSVLTDKTRFSDDDLNDFTKWPIFINPYNGRGTFSSSLILVNNDGKVDFIERSWTENQELKKEVRISFSLH